MPNIEAKIDRNVGDRSVARTTENVQRLTFNAQRPRQISRGSGVIVRREVDSETDERVGGKIDNEEIDLHQSSAHCPRLR